MDSGLVVMSMSCAHCAGLRRIPQSNSRMSSRRQRTEGSEFYPLGLLRDHHGSHLAMDNVLRNHTVAKATPCLQNVPGRSTARNRQCHTRKPQLRPGLLDSHADCRLRTALIHAVRGANPEHESRLTEPAILDRSANYITDVLGIAGFRAAGLD